MRRDARGELLLVGHVDSVVDEIADELLGGAARLSSGQARDVLVHSRWTSMSLFVTGSADGWVMRTQPSPQATLASALGRPAVEVRRALPYTWRPVSVPAATVRPARAGGWDIGEWFAAGEPAVAIVGVVRFGVVVSRPCGLRDDRDELSFDLTRLESFVCLPRSDPDLLASIRQMVDLHSHSAIDRPRLRSV